MIDQAELLQITYAVLIVGLIFICLLVTKIINTLKKYQIKYAHYGYLIAAIIPLIEFVKALIKRLDWYGKSWYCSPFIYFWLIIFGYFIFQFIKNHRQQVTQE